MTFRTPAEAVELANNTRYGLAASGWTESVNLALDIAPRIKAGTVWVNCTNQFDAASGFGGYRESGFGREGGREGMYESLRPAWEKVTYGNKADTSSPNVDGHEAQRRLAPGEDGAPAPIDRTAKLYIGGSQVRPD